MHPELKLQQKFVEKLRERGILCYKFVSPGNAGVPDLLCVPPHGKVFFIELKRPDGKGKLSALQEHTIKQLQDRSVSVYVTSDITDADSIARAECGD